MDWDLPFIEKYVFIGAAGHRLHHSPEMQDQKYNMGYLVLWDWLFGTRYLPKTQEVQELGLVFREYPSDFIEQMAVPFIPDPKQTVEP